MRIQLWLDNQQPNQNQVKLNRSKFFNWSRRRRKEEKELTWRGKLIHNAPHNFGRLLLAAKDDDDGGDDDDDNDHH